MSSRIGIPEELKSVANREDLSSTIHWETGNKDLVLCTYTVKTESKGKKKMCLCWRQCDLFVVQLSMRKNKNQLHISFMILPKEVLI